MKRGTSIWIVLGLAIGASTGVAFENIPAGLTLGSTMGYLVMLVSFGTVNSKNRK